jgi:hypothetical protein
MQLTSTGHGSDEIEAASSGAMESAISFICTERRVRRANTVMGSQCVWITDV